MKRSLAVAMVAAVLALRAHYVRGHGTPINVYVRAGSNQLVVFDGYEPGDLKASFGSDIFTDAPGIGVSSPVNGLAAGTDLRLNVVQGLLYWDGNIVAATDETLSVDWPDDGGTSLVEYYDVTADSGYQTGMLWGKYQPAGGTGTWDAHGDYALESANADAGIYGVVLQLTAANYVSSEPFLVSLVYDPLSAFGAADVAAGIAALDDVMTPLPTADFDRNTDVDLDDLITWQIGFASEDAFQVQGDATGDGRVAGNDFLVWQTQLTVASATTAAYSVPEPNSGCIVAVSLLTYASRRGRRLY